ncbi:hypothetical protein BX666DRAFT_1890096 [Dichotomocladium elegans]|nr:hypothetical protein BX666DRAFT_1890096 [Dichotomocladium elegans]
MGFSSYIPSLLILPWMGASPMSQDTVALRSCSVDHFVKESIQIFWRATQAVIAMDGTNKKESENVDDGKRGSVTWKLNITSAMITLDTNIQTVAGLEKVIEELSVNVRARPTTIRTPRYFQLDEYRMPGFLHSIASALYLSSAFPLPKADIFRQYNSVQLMNQCVQAFILCDGAVFLTASQLKADAETILSNLSASREHPIETLLVLSICTMMIRHVMAHNRGHAAVAAGLMYAYYAHARMLLQDLFDVHDVRVIQSLMILSVYPHGHGAMIAPSRTSSSYLAMAIRMAFAMDLHRLDAEREEDSETKEMLRRMMWILFCADYFAEWNTSGAPGLISVTDWQVDFPRPLPGEQVSRRVEFLTQYCRVVMIRKLHLFHSAYQITMTSPKALESSMDEVLFKMYMNTPSPFRIKTDLSATNTVTKENADALVLKILYSDTLIYTYVPFLPDRYLETLDEERAARLALVTEIYDHVNQSATHNTIPDYASFVKGPSQTEIENTTRTNMELRTTMGIVITASDLTLTLELLCQVDPFGCHHSPIYGALITSHVYHMVEVNSSDRDIVLLCRINLVRTMYILQQASKMFAGSIFIYLNRILRQWINFPMDQPTDNLQRMAEQLTQSLRERAKMQFQDTQGLSLSNDDNDGLEIVKVECA